jgi:hypothetical protein
MKNTKKRTSPVSNKAPDIDPSNDVISVRSSVVTGDGELLLFVSFVPLPGQEANIKLYVSG